MALSRFEHHLQDLGALKPHENSILGNSDIMSQIKLITHTDKLKADFKNRFLGHFCKDIIEVRDEHTATFLMEKIEEEFSSCLQIYHVVVHLANKNKDSILMTLEDSQKIVDKYGYNPSKHSIFSLRIPLKNVMIGNIPLMTMEAFAVYLCACFNMRVYADGCETGVQKIMRKFKIKLSTATISSAGPELMHRTRTTPGCHVATVPGYILFCEETVISGRSKVYPVTNAAFWARHAYRNLQDPVVSYVDSEFAAIYGNPEEEDTSSDESNSGEDDEDDNDDDNDDNIAAMEDIPPAIIEDDGSDSDDGEVDGNQSMDDEEEVRHGDDDFVVDDGYISYEEEKISKVRTGIKRMSIGKSVAKRRSMRSAKIKANRSISRYLSWSRGDSI
jgi:hypothetical protein